MKLTKDDLLKAKVFERPDCDGITPPPNITWVVKASKLREVLKELKESFGCTCFDAYKERGMIAPDCMGCHIGFEIDELFGEVLE